MLSEVHVPASRSNRPSVMSSPSVSSRLRAVVSKSQLGNSLTTAEDQQFVRTNGSAAYCVKAGPLCFDVVYVQQHF